jgi:tetratricopeptide (TPR) repeat protein
LNKDVIGTELTGTLEIAAFLDSFEISDAPDFSIWKDRQQARLLPLIKDGLELLIERYRRIGEFRQTELLADRVLALDELSEEGIRAKAEARAMAGDRLTALQIFEDWKSKLWTELRALPSQPLQQMVSSMRRGGWERTTVKDIPASSGPHVRERVFVGRAREYLTLYETWGSMKNGQVVHSIVLGDSGVGKTTLVERFTTAASLEGASVTRVQSYDPERNIPFATLGGLISGLLDRPGASATQAEALAELARTVPEVRRRFPGLPLASDSQGENARLRLTEAFQELVTAVSDEHPVILVVDDLHLADDASLAVLHLVLRRLNRQAVMTIFTARPGELKPGQQASVLHRSLLTIGGQELLLEPLDEESSSELLEALLSHDEVKPSPTVRRSLIKAGGGFPMVLELLVQDWRTSGSSSPALALNAMTEDFAGGIEPIAAYRNILLRLTQSLDPPTRNTLDMASVLGHRLNDLSMYSIVDLGLGQTMAALAQLSDLRVLRDGPKGLEFTNELIRAHAYAAIPAAVRKALHASVADLLIRMSDHSASPSGIEIAWHCIRAGRTAEAIPHLLSGALAAMRGGAPQSAERALASALPWLNGADLQRGRLLLVEALQEQGRWRESLCALEEARDTREDSNHETFALDALARVYIGTPLDDWLALLPRLKEIVQKCTHTQSRVRAAKAVAHATSGLRDPQLARDMLAAVAQIPTSDLDIETQGQLGLIRALLLFQAGDMDASYDLASSHLEELRRRGIANALVAQLQHGLGSIRARQGRYDEAATNHERAVRVARLLGNVTLLTNISANLAWCYGRLGHYEAQLTCAEAIPKSDTSDMLSFTEMHLACSAAFSHAAQGRIESMRQSIRRCEERLGPSIPPSTTQSWLLWKSDILMVAGLRSEAIEAAVSAVQGYGFRLESKALAGVYARWTALTCAGTQNEATARAILEEMAARLDEHDALDQVEILCANLHCGWGSGRELRKQLDVRAKALPFTALVPLRATGMLLWS